MNLSAENTLKKKTKNWENHYSLIDNLKGKNMNSWILAIGILAILFAIIYQTIKLIQDNIKTKKALREIKDDLNICFRGMNGSVSLEKKKYPDQYIKDDFREEVGDIKSKKRIIK